MNVEILWSLGIRVHGGSVLVINKLLPLLFGPSYLLFPTHISVISIWAIRAIRAMTENNEKNQLWGATAVIINVVTQRGSVP